MSISFRSMSPIGSVSLEKSNRGMPILQFSSVHSLSHVQLFVTPQTAAHQASLSITNSQSLLRLMSIELVMPSSHLILCHPLLLMPSIFPSIRVFSYESLLCIRWPKYWRFSFSIRPSIENSGLISFRIVCFDLLAVEFLDLALLSLLLLSLRTKFVNPSHLSLSLNVPWLWRQFSN